MSARPPARHSRRSPQSSRAATLAKDSPARLLVLESCIGLRAASTPASQACAQVARRTAGYGIDSGGGEKATARFSSGSPVPQPDPEQCFNFQNHGAWTIHDVVAVEGFNEALVYAFKSDNQVRVLPLTPPSPPLPPLVPPLV